MEILIKLIVINVVSFIGGFMVAFFEDKYNLGIFSAMAIFSCIGAFISHLF